MAKRAKNDHLASMEELQDELLGPVEDWPIEDVFEILSESSGSHVLGRRSDGWFSLVV